MDMPFKINVSDLFVTFYTLIIGAIGAGVAHLLSIPVAVLMGPAIFISVISLLGFKFAISDTIRDIAFLMIGIGIGAGVNAEATSAFMRWPLAFLVLGVTVFLIVVICKHVLCRYFEFDHRSAVLAASPGHLSYVIGLGTSLNADVTKIAISQSIRLLALTICAPFVAIAFGMEVGSNILPAGVSMQSYHLMGLFIVSGIVGLIFKVLKVPAALLIAGLIVSSLAHATEVTVGVLPVSIATPCFILMGSLIGTRFSGTSLQDLKSTLLAGLSTTFITVVLATMASIPVAYFLSMPIAHVFIAFSPGGLETMVAMGVVLGANPGFVAAGHVGRLLLLTVIVPMVLGFEKSK